MACLENLSLDFITKLVLVLGLPSSLVLIYYNIKATNQQREAISLQRRAMESSIFQKLARATADILSKPLTLNDQPAAAARHYSSSYTLNYISFLILHDYLPKKMRPFFKDDILGIYKVLTNLTPEKEKIVNPSQYRYLLKCGKKFAEEELLQEQPQS